MHLFGVVLFALLSSINTKSDFEVVRVIWTSDLHAQLTPTIDFASAGTPRRRLGGINGLVKLIKEQKTPATILLDNGNFAFGSPEGDSSQGRVMVYFMNRLGYDAAVLGARDFRDGLVGIELLARSAGFPILADPLLNILLNRQSPLFQPYLVKDVRGIKVGIIGIGDPQTPILNSAKSLSGLVIDEPLQQVRRLLPAVKSESVEVIIVLGHITTEQGRTISESLPDINLIICRGEQLLENQLPRAGTAAIAISGVFGQRVGVADILFHKIERRVYAVEMQVLNVDPEDSVLASTTDLLLTTYDTIIANSENEFFPDEKGHWQMSLTIAEALRQENRAELVVIPSTVVAAGLPSGPLTRRDLYNSLPYHDRLRLVAIPETLLNKLVNPPGSEKTQLVPAIAGADLFVIGDTTRIPSLASFAGIRLRERKKGVYKVITTETWLEHTGIPDKGKPLSENLTAFWLRYASAKGKVTAATSPHLYPATPLQVQRTQENQSCLININTADEKLLCQLPGIGPKTAQRIIEYRQTHGGFKTVEEIMNVRGIGPKKFEQIKQLITLR